MVFTPTSLSETQTRQQLIDQQLARAGWLEDIAAERTLMPHSIMRRVVREQANTASAPDFDGWLKHAEEALP